MSDPSDPRPNLARTIIALQQGLADGHEDLVDRLRYDGMPRPEAIIVQAHLHREHEKMQELLGWYLDDAFIAEWTANITQGAWEFQAELLRCCESNRAARLAFERLPSEERDRRTGESMCYSDGLRARDVQ